MGGELQEMARDLGGAAHLAVQQHECARAFRIEGTAVEQIGEGADRGEAVVQGVENVGGAFVENNMLNVR